jgi:DNA-binding phage protein
MLVAAASAILIGGGTVAVAAAQKSNSQSSSSTVASLGKDDLLDDVAKRLGIDRSKLDSALQAIALDKVDFAVDAGFLSKDQGDLLKERIKSGMRAHFGLGLGLGHFGVGENGVLAAAQYIGVSVVDLRDTLADKTLAQVAKDHGKSIDGLKKALRDAVKEELDSARTNDLLTQKQEDALLSRFDATVDDVVNGHSPQLTELAKKLGIDRSKVEDAFKAARIDQVDAALAQGLVTKDQADALKKRIQSGAGFGAGCPGRLGLGVGPGFRGGLGHHVFGGFGAGFGGGPAHEGRSFGGVF